jgi:hypothetical protein
LTITEVSRSTALWLAVSARSDRGLCPVGQSAVIGQPISPRHAGWKVVIVERFHPEMNSAGIAFERVRFNDSSAQKFEFGRQRIG